MQFVFHNKSVYINTSVLCCYQSGRFCSLLILMEKCTRIKKKLGVIFNAKFTDFLATSKPFSAKICDEFRQGDPSVILSKEENESCQNYGSQMDPLLMVLNCPFIVLTRILVNKIFKSIVSERKMNKNIAHLCKIIIQTRFLINRKLHFLQHTSSNLHTVCDVCILINNYYIAPICLLTVFHTCIKI